MSSMKSYIALRYRFIDDLDSWTKLYNVVRTALREPDHVEYRNIWNGKNFDCTNEITYFWLESGSWRVYRTEDEVFVIDYVFRDDYLSGFDVDAMFSMSMLQTKMEEIKGSVLGEWLYPVPKFTFNVYYSGCEVPVNWGSCEDEEGN